LDPLKLDRHLAEQHRRFWEAVASTDALRLHSDRSHTENQREVSRHDSIYIDVRKLLEDPWFHEKSTAKLRELPCPDLVLLPLHPNSNSLAQLIRFALPRSATPPIVELPAGRFSEETARRVQASERVLVADDGLVSGHTLRGIKTEIYRVCQSDGRLPELDCFVVLSRPRDQAQLDSVRLPYFSSDGNHLHCAYEIFLPSGSECPWCLEHQHLGRICNALSPTHRALAIARMRHLESMAMPNVLDTRIAGAGNLKTLSSFFGELPPHVGFAAAAAATHALVLRCEAERRKGRHQSINLLFSLQCYFEACFRSGLLRTVGAQWVRREAAGQDLQAFLETLPASREYPGGLAELGWGAICEKLPARVVYDLLLAADADDEAALLYSAVLELASPTLPV
jgi:hypothetical protein